MGAEILSDSLLSAWCSSLCSQQLFVKGVHYGGASPISVWCAGLSSGGIVLLSSDHSVDPLRNRFENSEKNSVKPNKDVAIPAVVRQAVFQLHVSTGHRSRLGLARALLISGAPASAIEAAKQLKCSLVFQRLCLLLEKWDSTCMWTW